MADCPISLPACLAPHPRLSTGGLPLGSATVSEYPLTLSGQPGTHLDSPVHPGPPLAFCQHSDVLSSNSDLGFWESHVPFYLCYPDGERWAGNICLLAFNPFPARPCTPGADPCQHIPGCLCQRAAVLLSRGGVLEGHWAEEGRAGNSSLLFWKHPCNRDTPSFIPAPTWLKRGGAFTGFHGKGRMAWVGFED